MTSGTGQIGDDVWKTAYRIVEQGERFRNAILQAGEQGDLQRIEGLGHRFCDIMRQAYPQGQYLDGPQMNHEIAQYARFGQEEWELDLPEELRFRQLIIGVCRRVEKARKIARTHAAAIYSPAAAHRDRLDLYDRLKAAADELDLL
ncbi:hypothetical protein HII31_02692 [Pseudocercospora fuligena]|uniref:Uncharacterized protein n=1 Tax=Pseudocercospora fuligena TaxID=685502 RepID=A0A8H6RQ52_9PEZI|nr:hypothetical protein HII31_02692 [Pseudocercospora fuligena]